MLLGSLQTLFQKYDDKLSGRLFYSHGCLASGTIASAFGPEVWTDGLALKGC